MGVVVAALLCTMFFVPQAMAEDDFEDMRFSKEEVQLLKDLRRVEEAANLVRSVLAAAPFVQLFSASNPADIAITVAGTDFARMAEALTAIEKIKVCRMRDLTVLFIAEGRFSSDETRRFIQALHDKYNALC